MKDDIYEKALGALLNQATRRDYPKRSFALGWREAPLKQIPAGQGSRKRPAKFLLFATRVQRQ